MRYGWRRFEFMALRKEAAAVTREHKLALIIGFSLILFVGILISDHLSKAGGGVYQDPPDAEQRLAQTIGPMDVGLGPRRLPDRPAAALEQHRTAAERARQADAEQRQAQQPPASPADAAIDTSDGNQIAAAEDFAAQHPLLIPVEPASAAGPGESLVQSGWRVFEQVVNGIGEGALSARPALEIEQSRGAPSPGAVLPEEPFVTHVVQPRESLYQIAENYYGSGVQWTRIRDFNADRIAEGGMVRVGVTIRIPGVEDRPAASRTAVAPRPAPQAPATPRTYTVRKNDTLGEIAQQLLGSARRRAEIVALNRDKIANEDEIRVGMVLAIPAG